MGTLCKLKLKQQKYKNKPQTGLWTACKKVLDKRDKRSGMIEPLPFNIDEFPKVRNREV